MEFFLPGLAALLIAALIVFIVLPRLGAPILAVLSIVLLVYGVYNHIQLFSSEYAYSTWQDRLKFYAPFVMIGGLILAIIFYMTYLVGSQGVSALPATNVPVNNAQVVEAVNTVTANVNNVANAVTNTVTNTVNSLANVIGLGGNNNRGSANKNQGVLANLGAALTTPFNRRPNNRA
jgi:hypothetical protein